MKNETLLILGGLGLLYLINKSNAEQSSAGAADSLQLQTHSDPNQTSSPSIDTHEDGGGILTSGREDESMPPILPAQTTYPVVFHPILTDPIEPVNTDQPPVYTRSPNGPLIYIDRDPEIQ